MRRVTTRAIFFAACLTACATDEPRTSGDIVGPGNGTAAQVAPEDTGTYLVLLNVHKSNAAAVSRALVAAERGREKYLWQGLSGFAISGITEASAARIRSDPRVRLVERDEKMAASGDQVLPGGGAGGTLWALDRIDVFGSASYDSHFLYDHTGAGTHIYVIDTGVRGGHVDFTGRIGNGACFITFSWNCSQTIDPAGHGTLAASLAAGTTHGVAKQATIHPVRVGDDGQNFWFSDIVAGIDWVMSNRVLPAVATISINGYPSSFSIRDAITALINTYGVLVFKSAGNATRDAFDDRSNRSPFSVIVGATHPNDARVANSNWGATVNLMAPGINMEVASSASDVAVMLASGTSLSAPLAAGAAAAILSANPALTPAQLRSVILNGATPGVVTNGMGVANLVLYSRVTVPYVLYVSILGPTLVLAGSTCLYSASVSGAPGPYTYAWTVNGSPAGGNTNSLLVTNSGSSYDVAVSVSAPGAAGGTNVAVEISPSAPSCAE